VSRAKVLVETQPAQWVRLVTTQLTTLRSLNVAAIKAMWKKYLRMEVLLAFLMTAQRLSTAAARTG